MLSCTHIFVRKRYSIESNLKFQFLFVTRPQTSSHFLSAYHLFCLLIINKIMCHFENIGLFIFLAIGKKPKPLFEAGFRNPPSMVNHTLHYPKTSANNDLSNNQGRSNPCCRLHGWESQNQAQRVTWVFVGECRRVEEKKLSLPQMYASGMRESETSPGCDEGARGGMWRSVGE